MKIFLYLVIGVEVLALVLVLALLLVVPGVVRSDAVRSRIEAAARDALGREVRYADLGFGLFPPSLLVVRPSIAGASEGDVPFVEAQGIALRIALLPLLSRAVVVDSFVIDGAVVHLRRTARGIELPRPPPPRGPVPEREEAAPTSEPSPESDGPAVDLAVRGFSLRGARVVFEDRTVTPPLELELRDVNVSARVDSLDAPIGFDASARISAGGALSASGTASLDGSLDCTLTLDAVDLSPARSYLGDGLEVAGAVSGKVTARGPVASPTSLRVELSLPDASVKLDEIAMQGPLTLVADLEGDLQTPNGRFELDATDAELRYGGAFDKQPGKPATVTGRIVTGSDGQTGLDDVELQIGNARARSQVRLGARTRVVASVEPFDLRGWDEMVPALAEYGLSGLVRMDELVVLTAPLDLRGAVHLDSVRGQVPDRGPIVVNGAILAEGDAIRTQDLTLRSANQVVQLNARIDELGTGLRYLLQVRSRDTDTNELVSAFTSRRDTFFGLLDFDGDVSGTLRDGPPLQFAEGRSKIDIRDGKVVGLSLLHALFYGLGEAGQTAAGLAGIALDMAQIFTQRDLQRFYGEEFESLSGTFRLGGGVASTDDLRLVYRDYTADLKGRFDLRDSKFEMVATLTLGEAVDRALGGARSASAAKKSGPLVIPVPIRGHLSEEFRLGRNPTLDVTPQLVAAVARRYLADELEEVEELTRQGKDLLDEQVGEGTGDLAEDIIRRLPGLGDLLGGGQRREQPQPTQ